MAVIFYYSFWLLYRPYDYKRAVSMVIAGNMATVAGVVLSGIIIAITSAFFFPNPGQPRLEDDVLQNAAPAAKTSMPACLLFMIMMNNLVCNFAIGSFISVITSYAGKLNQTKDKPADLGKDSGPKHL